MERGFMKKGVVVSHVVVKGSRDRRQGELWLLLREIVVGREVMEWGFMMKGVVVSRVVVKGSHDHCQGESWSLLFAIVR